MKTKKELVKIAMDAYYNLPQDLTPSEVAYVFSLMMRGYALAISNYIKV